MSVEEEERHIVGRLLLLLLLALCPLPSVLHALSTESFILAMPKRVMPSTCRRAEGKMRCFHRREGNPER